MMDHLPLYISYLFGLTAIISILWIYQASKSKAFLLCLFVWTLLQSYLAWSGLYQETDRFPPKIMLFGVFPSLIIIIVTFLTQKGQSFVDRINLKTLTYFHTIRIPVEIVLFLLYSHGAVSILMTFEGTNFDILSGLTAPIVAYYAFRKAPMKKSLLLIWNVLCLLLLLNVVITAVFAIPSPIQKLAFDQPNVAVLHFPYTLLPTVLVPLVLFAHLVAIRNLLRSCLNLTV